MYKRVQALLLYQNIKLPPVLSWNSDSLSNAKIVKLENSNLRIHLGTTMHGCLFRQQIKQLKSEGTLANTRNGLQKKLATKKAIVCQTYCLAEKTNGR